MPWTKEEKEAKIKEYIEDKYKPEIAKRLANIEERSVDDGFSSDQAQRLAILIIQDENGFLSSTDHSEFIDLSEKLGHLRLLKAKG